MSAITLFQLIDTANGADIIGVGQHAEGALGSVLAGYDAGVYDGLEFRGADGYPDAQERAALLAALLQAQKEGQSVPVEFGGATLWAVAVDLLV